MEPEENFPSVDQKTPVSKYILILIIILIALGVVWFYQNYQGVISNPQPLTDEELRAEFDRLVAEAEAKPFVFEFVPNALEVIALPAPVDTTASDFENYQTLKPAVGMFTEEDVEEDTVYAFAFGDDSYGEYINTSEHQFMLYQLHDELRYITKNLNFLHPRPVLTERIEGVEQIGTVDPALFGDETPSVYPSVRAVEGFLVAEVMSRFDQANAEKYKAMGEAFAKRGIMYGHYGASDVAAARSVVEQYFGLLDASQPDLFTRNQVSN